MEVITEKLGQVVVFKVKGRLDALTSPDFEAKCLQWIDGGDSRFAVDLGELEYISSAGIRAILLVTKKLKSLEGELVFASISGMVEKVFNIAGLPALFTMYPTLDEALTHLKR